MAATLAGPDLMESTTAGPQTTDDNDRSLIGRVASARDTAAFERLYHDYRQRLGPFMFRITRDSVANEEAFNDVMHTVWRKASTYNGRSRVSTWIFAIAYRQCLKTLRKSRQAGSTDELPDNLAGPDPRDDEKELVASALAQLSAEHRLVIELSYFQGYTYQEIGEIADCPENTVKTRVFHARRRLRQIMRELGESRFRG